MAWQEAQPELRKQPAPWLLLMSPLLPLLVQLPPQPWLRGAKRCALQLLPKQAPLPPLLARQAPHLHHPH